MQVTHCLSETCACERRDLIEAGEYHSPSVYQSVSTGHVYNNFVLHRRLCANCGKVIKAPDPYEFRFSFCPRMHALINEFCGMRA